MKLTLNQNYNMQGKLEGISLDVVDVQTQLLVKWNVLRTF